MVLTNPQYLHTLHSFAFAVLMGKSFLISLECSFPDLSDSGIDVGSDQIHTIRCNNCSGVCDRLALLSVSLITISILMSFLLFFILPLPASRSIKAGLICCGITSGTSDSCTDPRLQTNIFCTCSGTFFLSKSVDLERDIATKLYCYLSVRTQRGMVVVRHSFLMSRFAQSIT